MFLPLLVAFVVADVPTLALTGDSLQGRLAAPNRFAIVEALPAQDGPDRPFRDWTGLPVRHSWTSQRARVLHPAAGQPTWLDIIAVQLPPGGCVPMGTKHRYALLYAPSGAGETGLTTELGENECWPIFAVRTDRDRLPTDEALLTQGYRLLLEAALDHPGWDARKILEYAWLSPSEDAKELDPDRLQKREFPPMLADIVTRARTAAPLGRAQVLAQMVHWGFRGAAKPFLEALRAAENVPEVEDFVRFDNLDWPFAGGRPGAPHRGGEGENGAMVELAVATKHPVRCVYLVENVLLTGGDERLRRRLARRLDDPDVRVHEAIVRKLYEYIGTWRDLPNTAGAYPHAVREMLAPFAQKVRERFGG